MIGKVTDCQVWVKRNGKWSMEMFAWANRFDISALTKPETIEEWFLVEVRVWSKGKYGVCKKG